MKKFLLVISIASIFTACQSKPDTLEIKKDISPVDNAALYKSSILTDIGTSPENSPPLVAKRYTAKKIYKKVYVPAPAPIPSVNVPVPVATNAPSNNESSVPSAPVAGATPSTGASSGTSTNGNEATIPEEPKKKGWSDAAKGATVGAVGGAVAGAIINGKNRGKGAIIGGVVGAVGGYILGKKSDKKSGRAEYALN